MASLRNGTRRYLHDSAHDSAMDVDTGKDDQIGLRIRDLEEENESLAQRAASASQRFADYENEIRVLKAQLREQQERLNAAATATPPSVEAEPPAPTERAGLSRFGSFMRKQSLVPTQSASSSREQELEAALAKEQTARKEAEKKVKQVNVEVEDLSATLFQQANDMVASERKESAALRERLDSLESGGAVEAMRRENERLRQKLRVLEQRDADRARRLDRLDAAQKRIDRVRTMLLPRSRVPP